MKFGRYKNRSLLVRTCQIAKFAKNFRILWFLCFFIEIYDILSEYYKKYSKKGGLLNEFASKNKYSSR